MNRRFAILGVILIVLAVIASQSFYVVREPEQAIVLQFGEPMEVAQTPGLRFKVPFIQDVVYYEKRILPVDPPTEQVLLADQRRLDVDAFARYRIVDPLRFFQTVRDEFGAQTRIATIMQAALRNTLGNATQPEVLSPQRAFIMEAITAEVIERTESFGIEIVDVRIGRADVPEGTVISVYERMRSERDREAAEFRAQGEEQAQGIRSRADRERTVILAEAERDAQILRGEGDAEAIRVQAEAFEQDAAFFSFSRTLEAYRASMADADTTLVLAPTGDFFRYFNDVTGGEDTGEFSLPQPEAPSAPEQPAEDAAPAQPEQPAAETDETPAPEAPAEAAEPAAPEEPAEEADEEVLSPLGPLIEIE